jgi:hypothetical protein
MDPSRRPSRSRSRQFWAAARGRDRDEPSDRSRSRSPHNLSPAVSAASHQPRTPDAVHETANDYFYPTVSQGSGRPPPLYAQTSATPSDRPTVERDRQPSIRIRRSAASSLRSRADSQGEPFPTFDGDYTGNFANDSAGRPRSASQPERSHVTTPDPTLARHSRRTPQIALPRLTEEGARPSMAELGLPGSPLSPARSLPDNLSEEDDPAAAHDYQQARKRMQKRSRVSRMWPNSLRRNTHVHGNADDATVAVPMDPHSQARNSDQDEYGEELVDWLDIIDPEVQTLSTLTNVQNSLFVPDLGNWINRRPTYVLSEHSINPQVAQLPRQRRRLSEAQHRATELGQAQAQAQAQTPGQKQAQEQQGDHLAPNLQNEEIAPALQRSSTITSRLTESHYAALPHGESLEGWTAEEKWQLDDHVRHMLHSRRARWKRSLKGFGQYVRRPLGFFVTLYATLITLFGLAWVLFLIGWIYVGEKQVYAIHVIDSVLVALFAIMGDGLAPFRAIDTYHLIFIWRYTHKINTIKEGKQRARLQKRSVPSDVREMLNASALTDRTQNPDPRNIDADGPPVANPEHVDAEDAKAGDIQAASAFLTYKQAKSLAHHQKKLAKSHSFYKPAETFTHHAFPLAYLKAIVILLDCHSCLQISLGATTWGIDYHTRPFAITTVILCVSITCNITAGLLISLGDRKTRKKDVWELLTRQELTSDAIKLVQEKREKEGASPTDKDQDGSDNEKEMTKAERRLLKGTSSGSDRETEQEKADKKTAKAYKADRQLAKASSSSS